MKLPSLRTTFAVWALLFFVSASHVFVSGEAQAARALMASKAGAAYADQVWWTMVTVMVSAFTATVAGAGVLVWQAARRKKWAKWGVTLIAIWVLYEFSDSVYWAWQSDQVYPAEYGLSGWQWNAIYLLLWGNMVYAAHWRPKGAQAETISH